MQFFNSIFSVYFWVSFPFTVSTSLLFIISTRHFCRSSATHLKHFTASLVIHQLTASQTQGTMEKYVKEDRQCGTPRAAVQVIYRLDEDKQQVTNPSVRSRE